MRDSCGRSGTGVTPQAFTPRRLTARPAESEHLEGKSTTLHYFVNSNKVCENSLVFRPKLIVTEGTRLLREYASEGDPAGADRPRKASGCSGNQR